MNFKRVFASIFVSAVTLLLLTGLVFAQEPDATPLGTVFTYQGQLKSSGTPYSGTCDFQFALYDALTAGSQFGSTLTAANVAVSEGYFTAGLDFGTNAFTGIGRWLAISVRCPAGSGTYALLTPRQPLTASPYALALPGLWTQPNNTSPNLIGGNSANWVTSGVVGATIGGGGRQAILTV